MVNDGPIGRTIRQKSVDILPDGWGGRRWKKRRSGSEAEKAEDPGRLVEKGIEDRGNGFRAGDSQQTDGHIPEGGHDMGSVSGSGRTGVFPEDGVPDPVEGRRKRSLRDFYAPKGGAEQLPKDEPLEVFQLIE